MSLPEDLNMAALPRQPYNSPRLMKWFYCTHRVGSSLALLPYWAIKYALGKRPRPSWSLKETLLIDFTRRVSAICDQAGVQHAVRDPTKEPKRDELKETRFEWVPGISGETCCGVLDDEEVKPLEKVGTFIWERAEDVRADYSMLNGKTPHADDEAMSSLSFQPSIAGGEGGDLVGIYLHGGGYTHFSAHEHAQTSIIPRRLMQVSAEGAADYKRQADSDRTAVLSTTTLQRYMVRPLESDYFGWIGLGLTSCLCSGRVSDAPRFAIPGCGTGRRRRLRTSRTLRRSSEQDRRHRRLGRR